MGVGGTLKKLPFLSCLGGWVMVLVDMVPPLSAEMSVDKKRTLELDMPAKGNEMCPIYRFTEDRRVRNSLLRQPENVYKQEHYQ